MSESFPDSNAALQDEVVPVDRTATGQRKGGNGCMYAGIGCGIVLLICVAAAAYGVWWFKQNVREFGTEIATSALKSSISDLEIPDEQRDRIEARIDEVGKLFKDGQLSMEQVGVIFEKLAESPLLSAGMSLYFQSAYVSDSGLSDEEKESARMTARRFIRGSIDGTIDEPTRERVLDEVSETDEDGARKFPESLTDDELRTFIEAMKTAADEAGVAEDVPEINLADEFDLVVDQALAEAGVTAEAEESEIPSDAP